MEPLVDTVIEDPRWAAFGLAPRAEAAARAVLAELSLPDAGFTLCVMGCDDDRIAALNADFRGRPQPTNVLSWPSDDRAPPRPGAEPPLPQPGSASDPAVLGDIAIAWETCAREAEAQGKALADHVTHLVAHGILHLLGFDHVDDADAERMEAIETRALARIGVPDPYA
jgi:probable rRNA maturation factor